MILDDKPNCPISGFQHCLQYMCPWKDRFKQRKSVPLLADHAETQKTCGELSANYYIIQNVSVRLFILFGG